MSDNPDLGINPPGFVSAGPAPAPSVARRGGRGLILLVEDDPLSRKALQKIFAKLGYEVHAAATVSEALALLEFGPFGVVLDLMLPDGDGLVVLRKLRSEGAEVKVVVTTGVHDPERLEDVRRHRPDALLRKPIDLDELLRALGCS